MNPREFIKYWSERPLDVNEFLRIIDEYYELQDGFPSYLNAFKDWVFERQGQVGYLQWPLVGFEQDRRERGHAHAGATASLSSMQYGPSYYEAIGSPFSRATLTPHMESHFNPDIATEVGLGGTWMGVGRLYQSGLSYESKNIIKVNNEFGGGPLGLCLEGTVTECRKRLAEELVWSPTTGGFEWLTYSLREVYSNRIDEHRRIDFEVISAEVWDWDFKYVGKKIRPSLNYPGGIK